MYEKFVSISSILKPNMKLISMCQKVTVKEKISISKKI